MPTVPTLTITKSTPARNMNNTDSQTVRKIPRKLSGAGICGSCENDAQLEFMTCCRCMDRFHVRNCPEEDDQCTDTFFKGWPNILTRYPNFGYTCDDCQEKIKLNNEDILVNRLAVMEESIAFLVHEMKAMKENPTNASKDHPPPVTYADKVANKPAVIVIEKKQDEDSQTHNTNMNKLKDAAVQSSAGVLRTYKNGVQNTVLVCRNESSKEKLLPHVATIFPQHKVSTPPSRLPTVTIRDIESEISKIQLLEVIQKQNRDNGLTEVTEDNFNILFIKKVKAFNHNPETYQAVVRVSDQIRDTLKIAGDRVCINLQSCKVVDRLFVRRCNKCQEFKHFHRECKSEVSICGKCGEQHDTRQCASDITKCINCATNGHNHDHETSWFKCPSYLKEQEKLQQTIPYYNTKNM